MTAGLGNQDRYRDSGWSGESDSTRSLKSKAARRGCRRGDPPFEIDCVVVGRMTADRRAWRRLGCTNMQVRQRSGGMARLLSVNVQEGRLKEATEEGRDTQNYAGRLHRILLKSTTRLR